MYKDLKKHFWWDNMKKEVAEHVAKYMTCQQIKVEHSRPGGKLQPLSVPQWKWEEITMDFISPLPKTRAGNEVVWMIVDRLIKMAHFVPLRVGTPMDKLAQIYIREVVRLHGTPLAILSNHDSRFVSHF